MVTYTFQELMNRLAVTRKLQNLLGSAGTGNDGDTNRVYTITTTDATVNITEVYLDGLLQVNVTNYTVDNSTKKVTMLGNVFDSQTVSVVWYA